MPLLFAGGVCCWAAGLEVLAVLAGADVAARADFAAGVAGSAALDEEVEGGVGEAEVTGATDATGETGLPVASGVFFFDLDFDLVALVSV